MGAGSVCVGGGAAPVSLNVDRMLDYTFRLYNYAIAQLFLACEIRRPRVRRRVSIRTTRASRLGPERLPVLLLLLLLFRRRRAPRPSPSLYRGRTP